MDKCHLCSGHFHDCAINPMLGHGGKLWTIGFESNEFYDEVRSDLLPKIDSASDRLFLGCSSEKSAETFRGRDKRRTKLPCRPAFLLHA